MIKYVAEAEKEEVEEVQHFVKATSISSYILK